MNVKEFKKATTGMLQNRPVSLRRGNETLSITGITVNDVSVQLMAVSGDEKLTLGDIWQVAGEQRLVGVMDDVLIPIFGYRVNGDNIILG